MAKIVIDKIRDVCLCPHCREYLFDDEFRYLYEKYQYCPYCGKEITVGSADNHKSR